MDARSETGQPAFLIAEAGVNHDGDLDRALEMVRVAAAAGADAIKFQTFRAAALVTRDARKADYQARNVGAEGGQLEMLRRLELGWDGFVRIKAESERAGILFLSTPFDEESARFLADLDVAAFKLGSGDLTNLPFLRQLAAVGKPLILSTGMATLDEVTEAVLTVHDAGDPPVVLLHCLSTYPAPPEEYNLRAIDTMRRAFAVPIGLSDHTLGWEVTLGGVALGAVMIEKHFTLDRGLPGPDHAASLDPRELAEMVRHVRRLESAMGDGVKRPMPSELSTREVARKSVVVVRDLPAGSVLRREDLTLKRPGTGLAPKSIDLLPGRTLRTAVQADTVLRPEHLA